MREGTISGWICGGLAAAALMASAATATAAPAPCGDIAGDDAALASAWAELTRTCPCEAAAASTWRGDRAAFLRCAKSFASSAVDAGNLRWACRRDLVQAARRSTCGRKIGAVACCKIHQGGGRSCGIAREASKCRPSAKRWAEVGATPSCVDACDGVEGPACLSDGDCDDGRACTLDACNGGVCENVVDPTCDPGTGGGGSGGTSCTGKGTSTHGLSSEEQKLAQLISDYRGKKGTLRTCSSLSRAAQDHANDMRDRRYYAHKGKNGSEFWERACQAGYQAGCGPTTYMGEIITGWASTAEGAFQMWKSSPGHDDLMKYSNYHVMGIGHACGGPLGHYWVVDFGGVDESSCR